MTYLNAYSWLIFSTLFHAYAWRPKWSMLLISWRILWVERRKLHTNSTLKTEERSFNSKFPKFVGTGNQEKFDWLTPNSCDPNAIAPSFEGQMMQISKWNGTKSSSSICETNKRKQGKRKPKQSQRILEMVSSLSLSKFVNFI